MNTEIVSNIVEMCYNTNPILVEVITEKMKEAGHSVSPQAVMDQVVFVCGEALLNAQSFGVDVLIFGAKGTAL